MGGAQSQGKTPLDFMVQHFKEVFPTDCSPDILRRYCELDWPAYDVGWPPEGSFDKDLTKRVYVKVTTPPDHPDQFPYIASWLYVVRRPPKKFKPLVQQANKRLDAIPENFRWSRQTLPRKRKDKELSSKVLQAPPEDNFECSPLAPPPYAPPVRIQPLMPYVPPDAPPVTQAVQAAPPPAVPVLRMHPSVAPPPANILPVASRQAQSQVTLMIPQNGPPSGTPNPTSPVQLPPTQDSQVDSSTSPVPVVDYVQMMPRTASPDASVSDYLPSDSLPVAHVIEVEMTPPASPPSLASLAHSICQHYDYISIAPRGQEVGLAAEPDQSKPRERRVSSRSTKGVPPVCFPDTSFPASSQGSRPAPPLPPPGVAGPFPTPPRPPRPDTPGPSRHPRWDTTVDLQMPLRTVQMPEYIDANQQVAGGGQKYVYTPFTSTDLLNWKLQTPSFTEDPTARIELMTSIMATHLPTYVDCNQLLVYYRGEGPHLAGSQEVC